MAADNFKVLGIKRTPSKEGDRVFVTFACSHGYSDYEIENAECQGVTVENVSANEDFGVQVGDLVEFIYGKAIPTKNGVYQPIKGVNFINRANQK